MSEGDCYDKSFKTYCVEFQDPSVSDYSLTYSNEQSVFDFWVKDGALDSYNMFVVNNNFSHMGGIAYLSNGNIAFVAQSVKSLSEKAVNEKEEIFIQIFDPQAYPIAKAYVAKGERSGLASNNGRDKVTNYGVKWLTSYGSSYSVSNVQAVATDKDQIVVLYELMKQNEYAGVYYIVLDAEGKVLKDAMPFSKEARLNPCGMSVYVNGQWHGKPIPIAKAIDSMSITCIQKEAQISLKECIVHGMKSTASFSGTKPDISMEPMPMPRVPWETIPFVAGRSMTWHPMHGIGWILCMMEPRQWEKKYGSPASTKKKTNGAANRNTGLPMSQTMAWEILSCLL